ncbi:MAG: hypothetical protein DWQ01_03750 [Planctomycetota bacterium]|nr:MAG: hypothetical protein DWQ01_03750 [Planctomycetota bacterium]
MTTLFGQFCMLLIFSLALAAVASGFRDDDPKKILRGIVRRGLMFSGAVIAIGAVALLLDSWFLRP